MHMSSIDSLSGTRCLALATANSALKPAQTAACDVRGPLLPALSGRLRFPLIAGRLVPGRLVPGRLIAGRLVPRPAGVRQAGSVDGPGQEVCLRDALRQSAARLVAADRVSNDLG